MQSVHLHTFTVQEHWCCEMTTQMTTQRGTAHGKDNVQLNELVLYEYNLNDKPRKAPANIGTVQS